MVDGGIAGDGAQAKLCSSCLAVTACRPGIGLDVLRDSVMAARETSVGKCAAQFWGERGQAQGRHRRERDGRWGEARLPRVDKVILRSHSQRRVLKERGRLRGRSPRTREGRIGPTARELQWVSGQWSVVSVSGQWSVVSGQWSVVSGQWSVVSGQWSVVSGQWSVVSGQWSVVSGQWSWSVVSGQWSVVSG